MLFPAHMVLKAEDICNLKNEAKALKALTAHGGRGVVMGLRNVGKTSVVSSIVIPHFTKSHKNSFVLQCDFLGVITEDDIANRLARAFEQAFQASFPGKKSLEKMLEVIKGIKPSLKMNPDGSFSLSISGWTPYEPKVSIEDIFEQLFKLEKAGVAILLVFDEFQDIHFVKGVDSHLRRHLEQLSNQTSVILLGSKKHILSEMLSNPKGAFYQWGQVIEFQQIAYEEFYDYLKLRFATVSIAIDLETCRYLQDLMRRNPEAINMLCGHMASRIPDTTLTPDIIDAQLRDFLKSRRSVFEEYLSHMRKADLVVMIALAKLSSVSKPQGQDFIRKLSISKPAAHVAINRLVDQAIVYHENEEYYLSDPLLSAYLSIYR